MRPRRQLAALDLFACEVGCQREQDLPVVGPTASGLCGDEPQDDGGGGGRGGTGVFQSRVLAGR